MGKGYVLINRRIEDHWLWQDKPFSKGQAWIDLIMMANFKDGEMLTKGRLFKIKRGQVLRTIGFLANRWGWSAKKVRAFLDQVRGQTMVTLEGTPQGTLITIENYGFWQTLGQESGQQKGQTEGQTRVDKRIKKINENKKEDIRGCLRTHLVPSFEEVCAYVDDMDYAMDPSEFYNYYQDQDWVKKNGQPIKDWKASVRAWESRAKRWKAELKPKEQTPIYHRAAEKIPDYKSDPMPDEFRKKWAKGGK